MKGNVHILEMFFFNSEFKYNVHMQLKSKCLIHPWLGYLHAYKWTFNVSKDNNVMVNIRLVMESKGDL